MLQSLVQPMMKSFLTGLSLTFLPHLLNCEQKIEVAAFPSFIVVSNEFLSFYFDRVLLAFKVVFVSQAWGDPSHMKG